MRISDWSSDVCSSDLSVPPAGYGWSRYYDDAVLTDRYGRVYAYRSGIDWNRSERDGPVYRDAPPPRLPSYDYGSYRDDGVTYSNERSEEHTSELQSLMRNSYAVFCLKKKKKHDKNQK